MPTAPPPLDGELRSDEVTRKGRDDDFGNIVHHMPEGVLLPGSADDVATTIQCTAQRGCKFAPQGQRHSTFGRSQVRSWIVADMSTLRYIGDVEDDRVVIEAGAKSSAAILTSLSRNLRSKDPPGVGFVTGIEAMILVGVATQDCEAPAGTRDRYMVHTMFRCEFAGLPMLVRGVAAADAERVDLIAEHAGLLTAVLEARHRAEDTHLWPRLLARGGEDLRPVVDVMESSTSGSTSSPAQAVVVLGEWREDPAAERRIRLAPRRSVPLRGAPR
jgi:hypothetical protein